VHIPLDDPNDGDMGGLDDGAAPRAFNAFSDPGYPILPILSPQSSTTYGKSREEIAACDDMLDDDFCEQVTAEKRATIAEKEFYRTSKNASGNTTTSGTSGWLCHLCG
jgi:hypothetical protein